MATPTITTVSPSSGPTGGRTLVEVTGTNFKTPTLPPEQWGPASAPTPTVAVTFGGVASEYVAVVSSTRLFARAPGTPLEKRKPAFGEGAVAVAVSNLDAGGVPVPGETATRAAAFTYRRPQLQAEADFTRVVRAVIREFRTQVLPNTILAQHTDYDPAVSDEINLVDVAQLPALVLAGPSLAEVRDYANPVPLEVASTNAEFVVHQAPRVADLGFRIIGVSDTLDELLNLLAAVQDFFARNTDLAVVRDEANPSGGSVRYEVEMPLAGVPSVRPTPPGQSNIRSFAGSFVLRGCLFESLAGFVDDKASSRGRQTAEDDTALDVGISTG